MENSSFNWVIENYDLGVEIGTQAADFINEKFGDKNQLNKRELKNAY